MVRTDLPDGTFVKVAFTPWQQVTHDANDNVLASDWYAERDALVGGTPHNDGEKYAALHAEPHDGTPTTTLLDNLGRPFLVIADNGLDENDDPQKFETRTTLDIEGNTLVVEDARGNTAETNTFAPGGLQLKTHSVDAGTRLALPNALGNPLRAWDNRQNVRRWTYDGLNRPTHAYLKHAADPEVLQQRIVYGESLGASADATNHLGQVYRVYDSAGVLTSLAYDFKGNLLATERRLAEEYKTTPDWIDLVTLTDPALIHAAAAPLLEAETFTTSWTYDALSRVRTQTTPDASVTTQTFGLGGMLQSVAVNVRGALTATDIVTNIDYNARGQRLLIEYGNGSTTDYEYDPKNFRVTRIHTERPPTYAGLRTVQDLRYHYDPSGNIAQIRDQAQQGVFFDNAYVDPTQKFRYDPTYRLVEATGREHDALAMPTPAGFTPILHPQDTQAQRLYRQLYTYDSVGNIREMAHRVLVDNVEQVAWRRGYLYASAGNRLTYTNVPGDDVDDPQSYTGLYDYDEHGNMITMAQIPGGLTWDDDDRLQRTSHVGGGTVYYVYDGAGQRVRKVTVNQSGSTSKQRLYFGSWETYREHKNINTTNDLDLERETLHVHDDHGRVCLIETKTVDSGAPVVIPANIARYQYSNHLGTANLELDEDAEVISYEEFHPYGTSSYRAANNAIEVSAKRYRYTGQERDEETGLAYHGMRYYAPWLARWTAADPIGLGDGVNRYAYSHNNPMKLVDPNGTRGEHSPFYEQEQRIHQTQQKAADVRGLISDLELERQAGETGESLEKEIAGLRTELGKIEQHGRLESAALAIARDPEAGVDLPRMREFSNAERTKILREAVGLRLAEDMFWAAREHVVRAPTAAERGRASRQEKQWARIAGIQAMLAVLGGLELAAGIRAGLIPVEARLAATVTPASTAPASIEVEVGAFNGPRAARAGQAGRAEKTLSGQNTEPQPLPYGPYHHRISRDKGGFDDIIRDDQFISSEARGVAGGSGQVNAHPGEFDLHDIAKPGSDQYIEFRALTEPKDRWMFGKHTVHWSMEAGEAMPVQILRAWDGREDALHLFSAYFQL